MSNFDEEEKRKHEEAVIDELIKANAGNTKKPSESEKPQTQENTEDMDKVLEEHNIEIAPKPFKKFVINIDKEYVEYFESLSPETRSKIINEHLKSINDNRAKNKFRKKLAKFLRHLLIILLTIVIGFPLIFFIVRSSIKSTLNNYKYMQVNFERLYKQQSIKLN